MGHPVTATATQGEPLTDLPLRRRLPVKTKPAVPAASWPSAAEEALAAPAGASWHRIVMQVNPYGYRGSSCGPLIVDQPEDDLDNRFVREGVVPQVRALKGVRQLVFSTHNANIPVLGDAELLMVLETVGRKGHIAEGGVGALDDETVLTLAGEILEGDPDAFLRRRYLYGF